MSTISNFSCLFTFGEREREKLDQDGHFVLPGVLTPDAQENLTRIHCRVFLNSHVR